MCNRPNIHHVSTDDATELTMVWTVWIYVILRDAANVHKDSTAPTGLGDPFRIFGHLIAPTSWACSSQNRTNILNPLLMRSAVTFAELPQCRHDVYLRLSGRLYVFTLTYFVVAKTPPLFSSYYHFTTEVKRPLASRVFRLGAERAILPKC